MGSGLRRRRGRLLARAATAAASLAAGLSVAVALASPARAGERALVVQVSAYNSVETQTNSDPWTAAWNDPIEHGMRIIAVSRDLLALGIERGTLVEIEGLGPRYDGKYMVLDKMGKRWKHTIDIYMGHDVPRARRFGRRRATLTWTVRDPAQPAATALAAESAAAGAPETEAGQ